MPEPTKPVSEMSLEELEALMDGGELTERPKFSPNYSSEPAPEPEPEAPEPSPIPEEPSPDSGAPAEPEAPVEPEPEPDPQALAAETERLRREKLEADLQLQMAHASRLAGEIGHLRKIIETQRSAPEPYTPETQEQVDRLAALEERQRQMEARVQADAVAREIAAVVQAHDRPELAEIQTELEEAVPLYKERLEEAAGFTDPALARQYVAAILQALTADAQVRHSEKLRATAEERRAASVQENLKAKKAAVVSGSGAVPSPPPKPKTPKDMTIEEADAWLRSHVQ